jgi:hypothetical protein
MSVLLAKAVDVSKLRYSEIKTLASGAKSVYINYGTEKLTIQTPIMSLPYGINDTSKFNEKNAAGSGKPVSTDKKYELTASFRGMEENPKLKVFHDKLKEIEKKVIDDAFDNRLQWFKDDYDGNKAFVSKMFTSIVKIDKDKETGKLVGKYPPTFKAKIPFDNKKNVFTFDCFDMNNDEVEFQSIMDKLKGAKAQLIIQLSGLWFAGGRYGCSWKITTAKFQLQQNYKLTFIEDSDADKVENSEEEDEEDDIDVDVAAIAAAVNSQSSKTTTKPATKEVVKDEEEEEEEEEAEEEVEEEEEEEEERPPTPPPPKKKTPATKKK